MKQLLAGLERGWWCICHEGRIWLPQGELPYGTAEQWELTGLTAQLIGEWQGENVWLIQTQKRDSMASIRQLLQQEAELFQFAGKAVQLAEFYRSHQFCGYCGTLMQHSQTEWACLCPQCHQRYYPQIAPCIIVAIRRGEEILLAKHHKQRGSVHTVLAGFVEIGETAEQAVNREVLEESALQVKNIRYITSQPWPFPHSLMMAFMAEYAEGELCIDKKELLHADWFHYTKLPILPPVGTVARRLIEDTVALCRFEEESRLTLPVSR